MKPNINFAIEGDYDVDMRKIGASGNVLGERRVIERGKNLITNVGMDRLGSESLEAFMKWLQVGTSATAAAYTDTALGARIAQVSNESTVATSWDGNTLVLTQIFTFPVGSATGTLAELGLATASNGTVNTRSQFKDSGGTPVTPVVLADEELRVTYRLRITPVLATSTATYNRKGVDYTLTLLPSEVGVTVGSAPGRYSNQGRLSAFGSAPSSSGIVARRFIGGSGAGTYSTAPSGTAQTIEHQFATVTFGAYTNGNHYRDDTYSMSSSQQNVANVTAWQFYGTAIRTQIGISPALTKVSGDLLGFTVRTSWTRA